jgi:ribosomal protein S18 acetylase RimI-like enzyme
MTEPYRIRRATPADADAIAAVSRQAFTETFVVEFAMPYHPDDLAAFLDKSHGPDAFRQWLSEPDVKAWVAESDGVIGYALTGEVHLPHPDAGPDDRELHRLYLPRAHHKTGVAGLLMQAALDGMADAPVQWLGVWSGNIRAQRFYARYGFEKAGEYDYPVGRTIDHEFILRHQAKPA